MRSTCDNNSVHQNESLSQMTSGLMHSHMADARSLLTHFNLYLKYQRTNGPVNAHLSLLHIPINMFEYYGI